MKTFIVDSFTEKKFGGNPAGVCIAQDMLGDETMLSVAQELNLSETAFIRSLGESSEFEIRFFSPKMEIPLCGHATLASARVVFAAFGLEEATFTTIRGVKLAVQTTPEYISMNFPVYETLPAEAPKALLQALGIDAIENAVYNEEMKILLVEIADSKVLAGLTPDFVALYQSHDSINGVLVTAPSGNDGYDFHSRYFWPWSGTDEDPVTGGTHTFLTKYWGDKLGKTKMRSFQSSKRSGFMNLELLSSSLTIKSQAVIVLEGSMSI